jgi:ADP-heptose:LPS heptosyltransferase
MSEPLPYRGEDLERPHIGVVFADSIGDFAVASVVMRDLRDRFGPCVIDYFGGPRTRELEAASPLVDARFELFSRDDPVLVDERLGAFLAERGAYDVVINLDADPRAAAAAARAKPRFFVGRCMDADLCRTLPFPEGPVEGLHKENWAAEDLLSRYPVLRTQHISEIWSRLSYLRPGDLRPVLPQEAPPVPVPDVLIGTGATRSAKVWDAAGWLEVVDWCQGRGLTVGLLGADASSQERYYNCAEVDAQLLRSTGVTDLRGRLTLPQVVGALAGASLCVSIDNGIMHLAVGAGVPTVALFGGSAWRVWAQPVVGLHVVLPATEARCDLCMKNRYRNSDCLIEHKVCMAGISAHAVIRAARDALDGNRAEAAISWRDGAA